MREIKFSYIAQREETGLFMEQIFTMEEIEGSDFLNQWRKTFKRFGKWIARRQYTGLKDKNGKEIYEGDIICNANSVPLEIYWNEMAGGFWQRTHAEDGTYPTRLDLRFNEKSIIGNIYENPELIKK